MPTPQALTFGSSFWLGEWARDALDIGSGNPHRLPLAEEGGVWFYIVIYVAVSVCAALILLLRAVIQTFTSVKAARRVHTAAISAVLAAQHAHIEVKCLALPVFLAEPPACPPVPPRRAPGGSGQLGTPRVEAQPRGAPPATASAARASHITLQRTLADSSAFGRLRKAEEARTQPLPYTDEMVGKGAEVLAEAALGEPTLCCTLRPRGTLEVLLLGSMVPQPAPCASSARAWAAPCSSALPGRG